MSAALNGFTMGMNSSDLVCYRKAILTTFIVFFRQNITALITVGAFGSRCVTVVNNETELRLHLIYCRRPDFSMSLFLIID